MGNVTYRLDGIDAPAFDQLCIDEHADSWTCGIEARDQLTKLIGGRQVRCDDLGVDPTSRNGTSASARSRARRPASASCWSARVLRLNVEASATGRFKADEARAKEDRQGLVERLLRCAARVPRGKKDGALLGGACRADRDREIREALFPEDLVMPAGCNIKGKYAVRARVTGNLGIYHLQACRTYPGLTKPDRWFCSEEDAQAAGFRRAYNCRPTTKEQMKLAKPPLSCVKVPAEVAGRA